MKYRLRILERAEAEVRDTLSWIEERSPDGAHRWFAAFEEACNRLPGNPFCWPLAPEDSLVDYEVRSLVFKTCRGRKYRAIYTVVDDEVRILHVRGPGRDVIAPTRTAGRRLTPSPISLDVEI